MTPEILIIATDAAFKSATMIFMIVVVRSIRRIEGRLGKPEPKRDLASFVSENTLRK